MSIEIPPLLQAVLTAIHDQEPESFVVGGMIRDTLIGITRGPDVDVVVRGDGFQVARRIAAAAPGRTFVPLDPKHGTGRLVVKGAQEATIDISSFKGDDIEQDLWRRDFTINAIAVKIQDFLAKDLSRMLDPTGGRSDLQTGIVRSCSSKAFRDDPLRILRAFRFQARLGFEIAQHTLELIPQCAPAIRWVAGERIRDELVAILATGRSHPALTDMDKYGVVDVLFPELHPMKGAQQNVYHHLDVWGHTLETVRQLEELLSNQSAYFGQFAERVEAYSREEPVKGRPMRALLKLAAIFHDAGKPQCMTCDPDGRIRFFGHEKVSKETFEEVSERLRLASREVRTIGEWIGGHMRLMALERETLSTRALFRIRRRFQCDAIGLMILFLADLAASRGPARTPEAFEHALEQVRMALAALLESPPTPVPPLLNGRDLITIFRLAPGPALGRILARLRELQGIGEITSREQALTAVRELLPGKEQRDHT